MKHPGIPTVLYRFFDAESKLLYVGISRNPAERFGDHKHTAPWWDEATSCTWERFATEWEAATAERAAIIGEGPVYNRQGKQRPAGEVVAPRMKWTATPQRDDSEVERLFNEGRLPKEIAEQLSISIRTIYRALNRLVTAGKIRPLDERSA